jgi:hypothetical protein
MQWQSGRSNFCALQVVLFNRSSSIDRQKLDKDDQEGITRNDGKKWPKVDAIATGYFFLQGEHK